MLSDVRKRAEHGLRGGEALAGMLAPSDEISVSSFDESNAFSFIQIRMWLSLWICAPPVEAGLVWDRLSAELRSSINPGGKIAPAYRRLAMGCSHSVHILMNINITNVGRSLFNRANRMLLATPQFDADALDQIEH